MATDQKKPSSPSPKKAMDSSSLFGDLSKDEISSVANEYQQIYESGEEHRKETYQKFVNHYYDLVTGLFEFVWGRSFHFAPRRPGESLKSSKCRYQHFIADQMSLKPGMHILDVGCGIGAPMAELARYSGAGFVGLNNNAYQIKRAREITQAGDIQSLCNFIHGDYMQIPEDNNCFDGAIAIESMQHAPDKTAAFREVFRVLRPGAFFAGHDWCVTDFFDSQNAEHARIIEDIEIGTALPKISTAAEICEALCEAGFEVLDARDLAHNSDANVPWYNIFQSGHFTLRNILITPTGRAVTKLVLRIGEKVRGVPKGTYKVTTFLGRAGNAFVEAGETGIFTPLFYFLVRKPHHPDS
ncbi:MAG: class I SAM-dependent methyltransferase [Proteobacteria bacterium]|nr:class I SAM-dependent methyltransferase [Pseudomonadota bacterium]